jgi:hypothetical protein
MKSIRFLAVLFLASSFTLGSPLDEKESFWKKVLRIVGISSTPSAQKGPGDEVIAGDIWMVNLENDARSRITRDGGYRSPILVAGGQAILALKGDEVLQITPSGGKLRRIATIKGAVKLVGISLDDTDKVLVLSEDESQRPAVWMLSIKSGQTTALPYDDRLKEDRAMLAQIRGWERYYGDTKLYVKKETRDELAGPVEWVDVFLKQKDRNARNVSKCEGINCGQPSLSQNGQYVLYIKATS